MHVGGWKPFWSALFAALLLFLPLAGGTVLLTRSRLREKRVEAAESQSGVAVSVPKEADRLSLLLCVAGDEVEFELLYLNASQNCINILALPGEVEVEFGGGEASLAACYAAAGPARCREALTAAFALPEDTHYLALSPSVLEKIAGQFGAVSVSFLGSLDAAKLEQAGQSGAAQQLSAQQARALLTELGSAGLFSPAEIAAARAAVWDAFFRQKLELLPAALPAALRSASTSLLTDLAAQDYYLLEETLEFLANGSAAVTSSALPAGWNAAAGRYAITDASRAAVQTLFNISPTAAQPASGSAP